MTWPAVQTKVNFDQAGDDPKQARSELADNVDLFNQMQGHVTSFAQGLLADAGASNMRTTLGLVIGTNVLPELAVVPLAEAQAGSASTERIWTASRVASAIAALAGSEFTATDSILMYQNACPTGWTKDTAGTLDNHAIRVVTGTWGGGTNGSINFSTLFAAAKPVSSTTADLPSHTHQQTIHASVGGNPSSAIAAIRYAGNTGGADGGMPGQNQLGDGTSTNINTQAASSGSNHAHTISLATKYIDYIRCTKA